ncbi:hypothetical protein JTE90_022140 [Oedothorax gibbosus]|uniref:Protein FAM114A2 n=1 Tax=Oedothorax gibbosus TaxID=931172 RepID=A0AAV6VT74_9ARAC|nr:hypothetical protein JTE90_022140 [Oedothorax gibbosus]
MSETDSDLDFESADEDAEFASNIKNGPEQDNEKHSSNQNQTIESPKCAEKPIPEFKTNPESKQDSKSSATSTEFEEECLQKGSEEEIGELTVKTQNISIEDSKTWSVERTVDKDTKKQNVNINEATDFTTDSIHQALTDPKADSEPKALTDPEADSVPKALIDPKADRVPKGLPDQDVDNITDSIANKKSDNEHEISERAESEFQVEKPRVMLRIEKKKQQKSQFTKEPSVEKASDLMNILHQDPKPQFSSWGFSSWGTSFLSTAASSVSTFSSQVTQGIETVFETVENTLGAPAPEDLAAIIREKKKEQEGKEEEDSSNIEKETENVGLLPDVSSWTKVFENTGSKVLYGGLDTLELIGKKTMDMLTEGDPGLRKKRAVFSDKVNIAELLREARAKAEEQDQKDGSQKDTVHYSQIFDEKQGLVHLEALEMLSNQCQAKLQRLLMRHSKNVEVKKRLEEIKSICEDIPCVDDLSDCENFEDFETVFKKHTLELSLPFNVENMIKVQRHINENITKFGNSTEDCKHEAKDIFRASICSLAEFTAKCIETFHKISELIIVQSNLQLDVEHCVTNLTGMTTVMCIEVNNISSKYHKCLETATESKESAASSDDLNVTTMATNLYVEAANSNKYIQDAYLMLLPVLQVCLLESLD